MISPYLHEITCQCSRCAMSCDYLRPLPAFADGPEPDPAQPLAAEAGRPVTQPDGDDSDTVAHG